MADKFFVFLCLWFSVALAQYGDSNQREIRRFLSQQTGYNQNFFSRRRHNNRLSSVLHLQDFNGPSMFVYPFNNRPITNPQQSYDQYGRPIMYPEQNYPNRPQEYYTVPEQPAWVNTQGSNPEYEFNEFQNNGDVKFPGDANALPTAPPNYNQDNGEEERVNFSDDNPSPPVEVPRELPSLTPVSSATLPPLKPEISAVESGFISAPTTLPPLTPAQSSGSNEGAFSVPKATLPPLTPVYSGSDEAAFPQSPVATLPPLTPAPPSGFNEPAFPKSPEATLPPLTPAPPSGFNEPAFPKSPEATLPPLTPAPPSGFNEPAFPQSPEATLPSLTPAPHSGFNEPAFPQSSGTTLPPLTPVPMTESRDGFNFISEGIFNDPCVIEGVRGNCVPIVNCEPYVKMLRQTQVSPQFVQLLRKAHCGFEGNDPKVCCPAPGIPVQPPPTPGPAPTSAPNTPSPIPTAEPMFADNTDGSDFVAALPQPPVCGSSNATFTRVVGGINAKLGDFPWIALLGYQKRGNIAWSCGGSLVSAKHVLTAAHCIHNLEKSLYVVRLGELDLSKEDDGAAPVDVLIKKMIKHEGYNRTSITNDIGMLVLARAVQFTDMIKPICIPTSRELRANTFENYNPIVAGWGSVAWDGPSASILQVLQLPVVSNAHCRQVFESYKQISIDDRVLCAGFKSGGKDACQGDSGGPLMQPIWNSQDYSTHFYQIGVVSFGKKCAEPGFPGVYTRVTQFIPWIEEKILGADAARRLQ